MRSDFSKAGHVNHQKTHDRQDLHTALFPGRDDDLIELNRKVFFRCHFASDFEDLQSFQETRKKGW